jgi:hypothetical protein
VVRTRILVAVGAWLLGVITATGLSLLAVSQLRQGLGDRTNQELTVSAVNSALSGAQDPAVPSPRPAHLVARPRATRSAHGVRPAAHLHRASPSPSPSPSSSPAAQPGTLLTSPGGTIIATCQAAGAYLLTWSPQQGYEVDDVVRGPAAVASVRFVSPAHAVTMEVSCTGNTPKLRSDWGGGGRGDE